MSAIVSCGKTHGVVTRVDVIFLAWGRPKQRAGCSFGRHHSKQRFQVLVAKGGARVGVAAAAADWLKRIRGSELLGREGYVVVAVVGLVVSLRYR